jgi:hypothetical protein
VARRFEVTSGWPYLVERAAVLAAETNSEDDALARAGGQPPWPRSS